MRPDLSHSFLRSRGFTLIELLLAIVIAAVAMSIVNTTFFQSHKMMESVRAQRETYQMVRIVMDRILKDLNCAYVPYSDRELSDDEISLYRFVGTDDTDVDRDNDSISFTTAADLGLPGVSGGICEVGYYLKEMEEQGKYYLMRRDDCTFHHGITSSGREMELAENVIGMNIEYIDKDSRETATWNLDEQLYLPREVRITITFAGPDEPFEVTGVASLALSSIVLKKVQG